MENNHINWSYSSDVAISGYIGAFIKQSRLNANMSQQQLATAAGVNRSTIVLFESGKQSVSLLTLIQILRALDLLQLLAVFDSKPQISPLVLAEQEMKLRKRATKSTLNPKKPKSDW
jgi:transcriptional regulator with XRE-family HTH domain